MSGYQSIPDTSCTYDESTPRNVALSTSSEASPPSSNDTDTTTTTTTATTHLSSLLTHFGLVGIGFLVGYHGTTLSQPPWNTRRNIRTAVVSSWQPPPPDDALFVRDNVVWSDGTRRPFLDSLPFENIRPRVLWNPVQPSVVEPASMESDTNSSVIRHARRFKHGDDYHPDGPAMMAQEASNAFSFQSIKSLLGPSTPLFPTTTTTTTATTSPPPTTKPHILYHANEAAFSLLYDTTNPKNYNLNEYALDYFLLSSGGFDAQINQAYCAVASVAALLNSLKYAKRFREGNAAGWTFDLPVDAVYDPYPYATQGDILKGECVAANVTWHRDVPKDEGEESDDRGAATGGNDQVIYGILRPPYGLNLQQTSNLLSCHLSSSDWDVTTQEVDAAKLTLAKMRYDLKSALIDPDARVMINYDRKALNQVGGGHYSPVGAYHAATDSFLIMDVAKYKYPPVWVGADTLMDAMGTVDECGWYDFSGAQERLERSGLERPVNGEEYALALGVLGCRPRRRGYIILRKTP